MKTAGRLVGIKNHFTFDENKEIFSQFSDKIVHIKSNTRGKDNWKREYAQRYEVLLKGVSSLGLNDSDIVSFCDLDEIIDPKLILNYKEELSSDALLLVCPHWFNVSWDCYLGAWDHYSIIFSYWGEIKKNEPMEGYAMWLALGSSSISLNQLKGKNYLVGMYLGL